MERNSNIKDRILKNKTEIMDRVLSEITDAMSKNEEVRYIKDLEFLGTNMIFKVHKENWVFSLDKARIFFESIEDYAKCKICRDLIRNVKAQPTD